MDNLVMIGQFILAIIIMVGLHEAGHFLAARAFGMRVEKFYIGIPPKIFSIKRGGTEYGLGAIPLGGFVKISGMVDESMDMESLKKEPEPWEFRAKPAWQRLIVMLGGIIMNIITAIVVFSAILYIHGKTYIPAEEIKYGIYAHEYAADTLGLQNGDKIIAVNGTPVKEWGDHINREILYDNNSYYIVERDNKILDTVWIPEKFLEFLSSKEPFIDPISPFIVGQVIPDRPAEKAGFKEGDFITKIDTTPIHFMHEMIATTQLYKGKEVTMEVIRDNEKINLTVNVDSTGKIGIAMADLFKRDTIFYSIGQSIAEGAQMSFHVFFDNIKGLSKVFTGQIAADKALSGPIGIAKQFGGEWHAKRFWSLIAFISMALAFMNLLPIPGLDGGHVVFLVYEMVSGKKPSDKFMEWAIKIGFILLITLIIFTLFIDIFK